ncbi:helix-hairpin-helix domain-containing protein [Dyadobacter sp. CY323]|uniref:ComEA family DNA-binding protein n=1 Tax=Dyadobacter sp. CY323 TaxID=2907302 RepID=UPI001F483D7F|nr:helix-hairpin-helix domain-containing protein [Dyadobacter sp. CY323]MCE6989167.1 helix-hairpin-helix domain-containing protein [Dyadobacter sp. CY323]
MPTSTYIAYAGSSGPAGLRLLQIALFFFLSFKSLRAQEPPREETDINKFISDLFPVPTEDSDNAELYESLYQLYANPLDLNNVSREELATTLILSETQLTSFFDYREKLGSLISLYELQAIPDFDLPTIRRLLPFVIVNAKSLSLKESLKSPGQHFLMFRTAKILERQKGFSPLDSTSQSKTRYAGSPFNGYLRYRHARAGAYSFGISMEKDAGEELWEWSARKQILGIDFTSFHAQIMNRGKLKSLIVGDYQMQSGQGMIMGSGFSLGKGAEVIRTTYRSNLGMRPYTSVMEANFFRGAAATLSVFKNTDLTVLYSKVRRDATQDSDENITTSLPVTGYHRTPTEREKHHVFSEQNLGFHLIHRFPLQKGQLGFTALNTTYSSFFRKRKAAYNEFEFAGKQNLIAGIHGDYHWQNIHFFGEGAMSKSRGTGAVAGVIVGLGKKLDFSMLGRHYARKFHSFYGNSFSEASRPINETGVYFGSRYTPHRHWQFSAYYDYYRFPWLKYQVDAPSKGNDYYLHILWKPNKRLNAYVLYHEKRKQTNEPGNKEPISPLVKSAKRTTMFNFEYEVPLRFSIRTRFQYGESAIKNLSKSKGFTVLQDITWHFSKVELSARLAWFKTDDYDSRQYVYEKDMLYAFSIPAYSDVGTRHYLMMRYAFSKKIKLWLRWSQTRYKDLDTISSGLNEINGNKRSEMKAQVMYQF